MLVFGFPAQMPLMMAYAWLEQRPEEEGGAIIFIELGEVLRNQFNTSLLILVFFLLGPLACGDALLLQSRSKSRVGLGHQIGTWSRVVAFELHNFFREDSRSPQLFVVRAYMQ